MTLEPRERETCRHRLYALYRFFDASGALLYVGLSANPGTRWKTHSKVKPWWSEVARVTVAHFPDRSSVVTAERMAIQTERPRHNIIHNQPAGSRRTASPRRVPDSAEQTAAIRSLGAASASFQQSLLLRTSERQELADAIVEAFRAGLRPSDIEAITPYDRNHIGRIRKAAGIPAAREATVISKRDRDRQAAQAWWDKLDAADRAAFLANRKRLTKELADKATAAGVPVGYGGWSDNAEPTNYWLTPGYRDFLDAIAKNEERR